MKDMTETELDARHAEKMKKKKAARDKILATKTIEKGLLIVHTGKGKGKVDRRLRHGLPRARSRHAGRHRPVRQGQVADRRARGAGEIRRPRLDQHHGRGLHLGDAGPPARHRRRPRAWERAKAIVKAGKHKLVLLDELNIVLRYDYLPLDEVVAFLRDEKPADVHVIVTGRNAPDELIEIADLVTEMEVIKHPFRSGVKAQKGIEF